MFKDKSQRKRAQKERGQWNAMKRNGGMGPLYTPKKGTFGTDEGRYQSQ